MADKFYCLPNVITGFSRDVADKVNGKIDTDLSDQRTGVLNLGRGDVFPELTKDTRRTGFDTELNAFAAGTFHFDYQFFVNSGDARLAVPENVDFPFLQQRAKFKDSFTVSGKGIVTYRKIDQPIRFDEYTESLQQSQPEI